MRKNIVKIKKRNTLLEEFPGNIIVFFIALVLIFAMIILPFTDEKNVQL